MPGSLLYLKYCLYALLVLNMALFFGKGAWHDGVDSVGWLILLLTFELETCTPKPRHLPRLLVALQAFAYLLLMFIWATYYHEAMWLDFVNATLWMAVVVLLTVDVLVRSNARWHKHWLHHLLKSTAYTGLVLVAMLWGMQQELLKCYDALLWIACFFAVEMNLLRRFYHLWNTSGHPDSITK